MGLTESERHMLRRMTELKISGDGRNDQNLRKLLLAQVGILSKQRLTSDDIARYQQRSFTLRASYDDKRVPRIGELLNALDREFASKRQQLPDVQLEFYATR